MSALNATKRDLAEFVSVLGTDTKAAVQGAGENINKILVQSPQSSTQEGEERKNHKNGVPSVVVDHAATPYDRCQAELLAVQRNSETYLQDPSQGTGGSQLWKLVKATLVLEPLINKTNPVKPILRRGNWDARFPAYYREGYM